MDAYLLFGHILRCKMVPKSQQHEDLFKGANRRFSKVPWNKMEGRKLLQPRTEAAWEKRVEKEEKRRSSRAEKLKALGYEYDGPKIKAPAAALEGSKVAGAVENGDGDASEGDKALATQEAAGEEVESEAVKDIRAPKGKTGRKKATRKGKKDEAEE